MKKFDLKFSGLNVSSVLLNPGLVANSSAYARGNENNAHQADGVYYLAPENYDLTRRLQLGF